MKKKQFYKILKTDSEVSGFKNSFDLMKETFPALEKIISSSISKKQDENNQETIIQNNTIQDTIKKQMGIAKSSLTFHKNHLEESQLSKESIEKLDYILRSSKVELDKIDFMIEQAQDYLTLTAFSQNLSGTSSPSVTDLETGHGFVPDAEGESI
ncbi:MAG: hypothetical protein HFG42_13630 [Lachnospiraceae bacterium]|nr:hypothetical protein [Lachnospiraceae bacterium]